MTFWGLQLGTLVSRDVAAAAALVQHRPINNAEKSELFKLAASSKERVCLVRKCLEMTEYRFVRGDISHFPSLAWQSEGACEEDF